MATKFFKLKTDCGIYFDAVSEKGILKTNRNGKRWHPMNGTNYNQHQKAIEIPFSQLPTSLQVDMSNYSL